MRRWYDEARDARTCLSSATVPSATARSVVPTGASKSTACHVDACAKCVSRPPAACEQRHGPHEGSSGKSRRTGSVMAAAAATAAGLTVTMSEYRSRSFSERSPWMRHTSMYSLGPTVTTSVTERRRAPVASRQMACASGPCAPLQRWRTETKKARDDVDELMNVRMCRRGSTERSGGACPLRSPSALREKARRQRIHGAVPSPTWQPGHAEPLGSAAAPCMRSEGFILRPSKFSVSFDSFKL